MMDEILEQLRRSADRTAVRELINRFMCAIDRRDYPVIASCFTDDAEIQYDVDPYHFRGGQQFADWMQQLSHFPAHTHTISNCDVAVEGDEAHSDTFGFCVLVVGPEGPGSVLVLGSRYVDTLVRTNDGWRISKRRCTLTWQFNAAAEKLALTVTN